MLLPVLLEPVANNGYRAKTGEPLPLTADGATREDALRELQQLVNNHLRNGVEIISLQIPPAENPWVEFAGMFKNNPLFDEWQQAIAENRHKADEGPDIL